MKQLGSLFGKEYKETKTSEKKPRSEREALIKDFHRKICAMSKKKFTERYIGILLTPYSLQDMYILYSKCEKAKNFAGLFWYFVKNK